MNPFHGQMSRSTFPRQNELIKERRLSRVKLGAKATFVPFYLFSPPTLPFSALLLYFPLQSNLSALLPLHRTYLIPPPLCLNSLWTPNANSVGHLIRHINSISPLIALIPLCNEFLCGIPSAQQCFTLRCQQRHPFKSCVDNEHMAVVVCRARYMQRSVLCHVLLRSLSPAAAFLFHWTRQPCFVSV